MPFIHIQSLPLSPPIDMPATLTGICNDFADRNGVPLTHVHATWRFFAPGHFAKGEDAPDVQTPPLSVLVDLLTPDFNDEKTSERMLTTLAASLSVRAGIPREKIFIHHRHAASGSVFDDGEVVRW